MSYRANWITVYCLTNGDKKLVRLDKDGKDTHVVFYVPREELENVALSLLPPGTLVCYSPNHGGVNES